MSDVTIGLIVLTALVVVLFCVAYARLGKLAPGTQACVGLLTLVTGVLHRSVRPTNIPLWLWIAVMLLAAAICLSAYRGHHRRSR